MGNQRNKQNNVDCHLVEFVKIIEPFRGEMFVIDGEFNESKGDDNEEKDLDPFLLTWQPRKKTQSTMATKLYA